MIAVPEQTSRLLPMREEDLERIIAIENTLYPFPWTLGNFRDSLSAGHSGWICVVGREIVGYAILMIGGDEAHLLNISIAAPWQHRGLGRSLLSFLIDLSRERYCERMLLEVRRSNAVARKLYLRNQFIEIGVRKAYYPDFQSREDAIVLERLL
jgi:ribosomal-protein-alanine N-acetyltransferase